jgi:hypothetical protein
VRLKPAGVSAHHYYLCGAIINMSRRSTPRLPGRLPKEITAVPSARVPSGVVQNWLSNPTRCFAWNRLIDQPWIMSIVRRDQSRNFDFALVSLGPNFEVGALHVLLALEPHPQPPICILLSPVPSRLTDG